MRRLQPVLLLLLIVGSAPEGQETPPPTSPFIGVVYRYADTMLERGRDTYGPQKSGLFLSALDRAALAPLAVRPAAPGGIRREDRVGLPWQALVGANPQHDENLYRLLYMLSELSGEAKYREAADNALKWFLENGPASATHLLPWGEHMSWNVLTDDPVPRGEGAVHEFYRPWVLWDRCFALAAEPSRRFALGLWEHQIADHRTGAFDRHAGYLKHAARDGMDFPRHAGFYLRTWADAYRHTREPAFLNAIEVLLSRYERKRHAETGLIEERTGRPDAAPVQTLSLAIDCEAAAGQVPEPLAGRLRAFAAREDALFCALPHDLKRGGFVTAVAKATGQPTAPLTTLWDARYGGGATATTAMLCVARYETNGYVPYRALISAAADAYLDSIPGEELDAWPGTFGHVISLELAAWRSTARPAYPERARALGSLAVERFWQDRPLPRASLKTGHYETITGGDTLALALAELHLHLLHITAVRCPANTIDR